MGYLFNIDLLISIKTEIMKKIILTLVFSILVSTIYSQAAKDDFCKTFTKNAQQGKGFSKSHFKYSSNTFIQVMDINEMAGDKDIQYELIVKEASDKEFINIMVKQIIKGYKSAGVADLLLENGFTHFQIYLLKKDGSKFISEVWKL